MTSVGDAIFASLSPNGDRLLTWDPPALWNLDSGTALPWSADPGEPSEHAIFSTAGDLVLLGGGVFQTGDGSLLHRIDPTSRASRFVRQALALAPEGSSTVLSEFGRATLETTPAPGLVAVLGGPPPPREGSSSSSINHLALSQDGSLLIANVLGSWAFSLRLAPDFAGSRIASTFFTEINADVDVSADGALAAIAGDGLALFGAADGQIIWQPPPPPPVTSG